MTPYRVVCGYRFSIVVTSRSNIRSVGVSAATGQGISQLFAKIDEAGEEFKETYLPDLQRFVCHSVCLSVCVILRHCVDVHTTLSPLVVCRRIAEKAMLEEQKQALDLARLREDMQQQRAEQEAGLGKLVRQLTVPFEDDDEEEEEKEDDEENGRGGASSAEGGI